MDIFRYKADSATGFERVTVNDDYQLEKGELRELPNPCYTPMVLDSNGNLVSNTLEGSNQAAQDYLKQNDLDSDSVSVDDKVAQLTIQMAQQQKTSSAQISMLTKQVATLQATVNGLTANTATKEG